MSILTGSDIVQAASQEQQIQEIPDGKHDTGVPGAFADDLKDNNIPVFDVQKKDFYQNMVDGRKRLRFTSGSPVQKFMQGSKYKNPFYIRYTDGNGDKYLRKIK